MALSIITPFSGGESPDDFVLNEEFGDDFEKQFRPSLSDRLQVGFLRSDKSNQTVETEILELKTLTKTVLELVEQMEKLRRDLHFSKQVIKAKYEQDLQNTTHELQTRLQEKLREMERIHEERVSVVRRSFKQQLQDALVKMATKYKKYFEDKLRGKLAPTTPSSGSRGKSAALQEELQRSQSIIQMMEIQIEDLRTELASKPDVAEIQIDTSEIDALQAQNDSLQSEISQLSNRIDDLSDAVEFREEKIRILNLEIAQEKEETEKERGTSRKLAKKIEEMKLEMQQSKNSWEQDAEKMRESLQESMAEEMKKQMDLQKAMLKEQERASSQAEMEKQRLLEEERKKFEKMLQKEREIAEKHKKEVQDSKSMEMIVQQQQSEMTVLKQRLNKTQRAWEKKFAILRSSLHALKDESYIRQQLQKQAASLKYASISYGTDLAVPQQSVVPPAAAGVMHPNKPLPAIRSSSGKKPTQTNTLPSGPGTEIFTNGPVDSGDEQEMDEYARGFVPLPSPPRWQKQPFGEYMPSVEEPASF